MNYYGNMGPFKPVSFKGEAHVNGVPVFVDKLPLTIGGIAGDTLKFGRVVSINPADRRTFVPGVPDGNIVKGVTMMDPTIMRVDPGMQDYYFAGRPVTATTFGIVEISEYDTTQKAPLEGSTVWCRKDNGLLAFSNDTALSSDTYIQLNAFVYESLDPNGAKIFFNLPLVTSQTRETSTQAVKPTANPEAGAVSAGTAVTLSTATLGGKILYTLDGTKPTMTSPVYTGPIPVTAAVTITAITVADGYDPSSVFEGTYTIS